MRLGIFARQVVRVVGRDQRVARLAGERDQPGVDRIFLGHPVPHDLDVEPVAEDVRESPRVQLGARHVVLEQRRGDQSRHAPRKDDQPFVVPGQQIHVDPRLVVVPLQKALGDQGRQVLVADVAGGQQRDVRFVAHGTVEPAARRDIGLAADDRREPVLLLGPVVELDRAEHDTVVGQRDARGAILGRAPAELVHTARAVQQRVLAMHVQVDERRTQRKANLGGRPVAGNPADT